jgi:hypothetical protein
MQRSDKIYYSFDLRDFCTNMSGSVYCRNDHPSIVIRA